MTKIALEAQKMNQIVVQKVLSKYHALELILGVGEDGLTQLALLSLDGLAEEGSEHGEGGGGLGEVLIDEGLRDGSDGFPVAAAEVAHDFLVELLGGGVVEAVQLLKLHDVELAVVDLGEHTEEGPVGAKDGLPGKIEQQSEHGGSEGLVLGEDVDESGAVLLGVLHGHSVEEVEG